MKKFTSILYYIFFFGIGVPFIIIAFFIWVITFPFDKRLYILHWYTQLWSNILLSVIPMWKIRIINKDKIDNSKALVFVSNHQSEFDILVMAKLYAHFKWVSKSEIFNVPITGWNMQMNKYVKLKRGDRTSIVQMITDCISTIENGSSVFIFPEGTRSKTGTLRNFSSGAFAIAKRAKVGIQPIAISGAKQFMMKNSWMINYKTDVTITVLDEIPYKIIKDMSTGDIAKTVRLQIAEHVQEHQEAEK